MPTEPHADAPAPSPPGPSWRALIGFGLATRLAVVALGLGLARPGPQLREEFRGYPQHLAAVADREQHTPAGARAWVRPWHTFDARWYMALASDGYRFTPGAECTAAFMPLLPLLVVAGGGLGLDPYVVALAVPNLAFVAGLACFGRVVARVTGDRATAWRAVLLLSAYPGSFVFSAPYHESLGFALVSASLLAWQRGRPALAAVPAALAALARLSAVALPLGLLAEWSVDRLKSRPARAGAWLVAAAYALALGGFLLYFGLRLGDPSAPFRSHAAWHRAPPSLPNLVHALSGPLGAMLRAHQFSLLLVFAAVVAWAWQGPLGLTPRTPAPWADPLGALAVLAVLAVVRRDAPLGPGLEWLNALAAVAALALGVRALFTRGPLWGALILVPLAQALATGSLMSMTRLVLSSFPLFLDAAELVRGRLTLAACLAVGVYAQYHAVGCFVNFRFVG